MRRVAGSLRVGALVLALLAIAAPVQAQRADENAVVAAVDAFGTVVGTQTIGLYNPTNARGFNPTQAENIRIEGFYFDQQTQSANPYLFSGTDMRVGLAAQFYAFPSPSGVADYKLRMPGYSAGSSLVIIRGPLRLFSGELDAQMPLVQDAASVGLYLADAHDFDYGYALTSDRQAVSVVGRIEPRSGTEIVPFFGYIRNREHSETPYVYADGIHPLPFFQEQDLPAQRWTVWDWNQVTAGIIARSALTKAWALRIGVFRSIDETVTTFNDLWLGLQPNGTADHVMDVPPGRFAASYSGDVRLSRTTADGPHEHELTFAFRARHADREYGGDSTTDLGTASISDFRAIPEPAVSYSAKSRDVVQQSGLGINYRERWSDVGAVNVGLLRTQYQRAITIPGTSPTPEQTSQWLPTASLTADVGRRATFYASYTRGLEDSVAAPATAVNRGEPPSATPTWQADAGFRLTPVSNLRLLLGGFEIHKTYFGLDTTGAYTSLGSISARGVESSATLTRASGLTIVAGAVWLRPEVERHADELGGGGNVPVGPVPRTINVNVDYAPESWTHWAASLQWTSLSSRVETSDDAYSLPPLNTLNLSARYRLNAFHKAGTVRLDAGNITNAKGLTISPVYLVLPQLQRNYTLTLTVDL